MCTNWPVVLVEKYVGISQSSALTLNTYYLPNTYNMYSLVSTVLYCTVLAGRERRSLADDPKRSSAGGRGGDQSAPTKHKRQNHSDGQRQREHPHDPA